MKKDFSTYECLDINDKDFKNKLEFELFALSGSSAYSNKRDRPYNGQPQTSDGIRGKTEVKNITFRDLKDCIIQGFLRSSENSELQDKVMELWKDLKNTKYESKNNWVENDIYKIDLSKIDPLAVVQNTLCFVEEYMGIYPNVPECVPSGEELINKWSGK